MKNTTYIYLEIRKIQLGHGQTFDKDSSKLKETSKIKFNCKVVHPTSVRFVGEDIYKNLYENKTLQNQDCDVTIYKQGNGPDIYDSSIGKLSHINHGGEIYFPFLIANIELQNESFEKLYERINNNSINYKSINLICSLENKNNSFADVIFEWDLNVSKYLNIDEISFTHEFNQETKISKIPREIENKRKEFVKNHSKEINTWHHSQFNQLLDRMTKKSSTQFLENNLLENDDYNLDDNFNQALTFVEDLQKATNKYVRLQNSSLNDFSDKPKISKEERINLQNLIWVKQDNRMLEKSNEEIELIDQDALEELIIKYMANPYMRDSWVDWIITDALAYAELINYYHHVLQQPSGFSLTDLALYHSSKGNPKKITDKKLIKNIFTAGLLYSIPIIYAVLAYINNPYDFRHTAGAFIIFTIIYLLRRSHIKNKTRQFNETFKLINKMFNVYLKIKDGFNPETIKVLVDDAAKSGVVYRPTLHSFLGMLKSTNYIVTTSSDYEFNPEFFYQ